MKNNEQIRRANEMRKYFEEVLIPNVSKNVEMLRTIIEKVVDDKCNDALEYQIVMHSDARGLMQIVAKYVNK